MCDEFAQSIEAPVPLRLADDSALRPGKPCDHRGGGASVASLPLEQQQHQHSVAPLSVDRALPVSYTPLVTPALARLAAPERTRDGARAAWDHPPFRPPLG